MKNHQRKLLELLETIEGNGSFESSGVKKITLPGIRIKGVGEIGFPIPSIQIREIIKIATKAPFGKGSKTITNTAVRSAWELNVDQFSFHNEDWTTFIKNIVEEVKEGLGIEANTIVPSLYKLLIYEEGDFFLSHKDSEKELGMFGTLIIGLPSTHTGGELAIRFDGKEKIIDFSTPSSNYKIPYVAFFADCDHEIKPITSGYRVSLVYNLIQSSGSQKISQTHISTHIDEATQLLKSMAISIENNPKAILLEHQYTPANFSINSLKQHDKPRAELLLEAAKEAGYFAALGLVTHYKVGSLDGVDYYYRHDENSNTNGTMGEVFEEYTVIEHWSSGEMPTLGTIDIELEDLISSSSIGEGEPIEEEEEGYTGNAGMTMEYWYHYGAVILWHKSKHLHLLSQASEEVKLKWLNYYNKHWMSPSIDAAELSKQIINQFAEYEWKGKDLTLDFSVVATILLKLKDEKFLLEKVELLNCIFKNIAVKNWVELVQQYEPKLITLIVEKVANRGEINCINHILEILENLDNNSSPTLDDFAKHHLNLIPKTLEQIQLSNLNETHNYLAAEKKSRKETICAILEKVVKLSQNKENDKEWITRTLGITTVALTRNYVNDVLLVVSMRQNNLLAKEIKNICVQDLIERTKTKPSPPVDWKRKVPDTKDYKEVWKILSPFLESADVQVFDYKKGQAYRSEMKSAIANVSIDLSTETIAKGSPHILRLTKTQASYERALKNWQKDVAILESLDPF